ncbi:hypothetical protein PFISCL1PPCAC_23038, partial [Pristionchus fissidentatus]
RILVFYKDHTKIVSGPLREVEATALYKAKNFFRTDHTFRVVNTEDAGSFHSIEYLLKHNAPDPFKQPVDVVNKELESVRKKLADVLEWKEKILPELEGKLAKKNTALHELQNSAKSARALRIEEFNALMERRCSFTLHRYSPEGSGGVCTEIISHIPITVRVLYGNEWNSAWAWELPGYGTTTAGFAAGGSFIFVAPYLSEDPTDVKDLVYKFPYETIDNQLIDSYCFP